MAAAVSPYAKAANAIYDPQMQVEKTALQTIDKTTKNSLEAEKGQVSTDYQDAIDKLNQTVQDQTSQISQLYAERLGGNFSGLQGNDMGQMFARANEQQVIIGETRANKLAEITAGETNADITANAGIASLTPKYQSLKTQYTLNAQAEAEKDARTQANSDRSFALQVAKYNQSASNSAAKDYKVSAKGSGVDANGNSIKNDFSNGYSFTGPNGKPINMAEYISGSNMGGQDIVDLLTNGSSYDRNVAKQVAKSNPQTQSQLITAIKKADSGNYYGF